MKKRFLGLVMSFIMFVTVLSAAMPVSAATSKTTATSTPKQLYVVPFKDNYAAIRETPSTTEKHPLQVMSYSRGDYCLYTGKYVLVEKPKDKIKDVNNNGAKEKEYEKWYMVETLWGQPGYVVEWAGQIVDKKPTKPSVSTTVSTAASTTVKPTTTTTKATTTTKKQTTTTTAKSTTKTTTTTKPTTSELIYLTSKSYTVIRSGKSTKTSNLGRVYSKDIAVADKKEGNWYHLIILNGKKKVGWCQANLMKEIPSPTTTITTTASTTASKPTTTTTKKASTTKKATTTTTKKSATTTTTMNKKVITDVFILESGGKTMVKNKEGRNSTKMKIGIIFYSDGSFEITEVKG